MNKHIGELVLSEQQIRAGVAQVAEALNQQFSEAVVISVVPGGLFFSADLLRELCFDVSMDYISCPHRPGDRNNQSQISYQQNINIEGKDVILVDDAIESGGTMKRLVEYLTENFAVRSLSIATLFVKPSRVAIDCKQYFAYQMANDDLLVGYGLPWKDKYRNTPFVAKLVK